MSAHLYPDPLSFALTPTPLQPLVRLSEIIGREVWIKRDDMTGCIATAGNKVRKLEYLLADALEQRADCIVTTGGPQSNHARAAAALAVRLGLEPILVFAGRDPGTRKANLLMNELLGARLVFSGSFTPEDQSAALNKVCEELRQQARNPYLIPVGGSNGLGTLGYIDAYKEYSRQAQAHGLQFDWIFVTTGSGGTHAGLLLGQQSVQNDIDSCEKLIGVSTWLLKEKSKVLVASCMDQANELLPVFPKGNRPDIQIDDHYLGRGYGITTPECLEAVRLIAKTEGIFLDQVYTGKTMAALLDYVKKGTIQPTDRVLFWHTGGAPGIFARDWA
ncbi:D-cysteine desulfhydrase family protein [Effusibacillus consociatus]|uniref:D-cysteine desulfhydrase family protein n=1 Tax=Effusibacillus consociatus TaxID=1117041 RepID=A0ABV9Q4Q0_9BACL